MNKQLEKAIFSGDFSQLQTVDSVYKGINYIIGNYGYLIPNEVIKDVNHRLLSNPDDILYIKQQLRYLVNWVKLNLPKESDS